MGTLRSPLILLGVGVIGFLYGAVEMNTGVEEDGVLILLGALLLMGGGAVWGALRFLRHLGAAVRRIGSG
jgi:LPXTG-motif cell wall-anchored protein